MAVPRACARHGAGGLQRACRPTLLVGIAVIVYVIVGGIARIIVSWSRLACGEALRLSGSLLLCKKGR